MINKKNKNLHEEISVFIDENIESFEPNYQSKFLKVFIEDKNNWAQQIMDVIFPEYFDGYHKILVNHQIDFYKKYRVPADYDELKEIVNDKEKDSLLKEQLYGLIDKVKSLELEHQKRDSVKQRAYDYFKSNNVKNAIIELAVNWKKNTFDTMKIILENALKAGEPKDSGHNYAVDVEKRLKKDLRKVIPILPGLDDYIGGGGGAGELISYMAPTGGGKSMMLVQNAVTVLRLRRNVVYYSLELSEEVVGQRFDACINNIPLSDAANYRETIVESIKELGINLRIKRYPDGVATVNTFYAHLEYLKCNENFVPDLIIVDYADNMRPLIKGEQLRHDLVQIYRELRAMAIEMQCPVITASQITGESKKEIELAMAAESKGKNNVSDIVVGFGRDAIQIDNNEATLKILKNRNGPIGKLLYAIFNPAMVQIVVNPGQGPNKAEKNALIGVGPPEIIKETSKNINNFMAISDTLKNQGYTEEIKD